MYGLYRCNCTVLSIHYSYYWPLLLVSEFKQSCTYSTVHWYTKYRRPKQRTGLHVKEKGIIICNMCLPPCPRLPATLDRKGEWTWLICCVCVCHALISLACNVLEHQPIVSTTVLVHVHVYMNTENTIGFHTEGVILKSSPKFYTKFRNFVLTQKAKCNPPKTILKIFPTFFQNFSLHYLRINPECCCIAKCNPSSNNTISVWNSTCRE